MFELITLSEILSLLLSAVIGLLVWNTKQTIAKSEMKRDAQNEARAIAVSLDQALGRLSIELATLIRSDRAENDADIHRINAMVNAVRELCDKQWELVTKKGAAAIGGGRGRAK